MPNACKDQEHADTCRFPHNGVCDWVGWSRTKMPERTSNPDDSPERKELNRVAWLLIREWERVEQKPVTISYYATFVDMARVVIADREAREVKLREALDEACAFALCQSPLGVESHARIYELQKLAK